MRRPLLIVCCNISSVKLRLGAILGYRFALVKLNKLDTYIFFVAAVSLVMQ